MHAILDNDPFNGPYWHTLSCLLPLPIAVQAALTAGCTMYIDPASGYSVFTAQYLQPRQCCGNKCRHCPHGWKNVRQVQKGPAMDAVAALDW